MALLDVLLKIKEGTGIKVSACHLNHQLRGDESLRDELFASEFCSKSGITLYTDKRDVLSFKVENKVSLEDAARRLRYQFFQETAQKNGFNKIATGHNANDNAESVLMCLLRGSGSPGLSGIPPVREGYIVRPLIKTTRSDIESYLKIRNLGYVNDSSNDDTSILRNSIRKRLIPLLEKEYNPNVINVLNRLSDVSFAENDLMDELAENAYLSCVSEENNHFQINKKRFNTQNFALKRRLIRHILKKAGGNLKKIGLVHVDMVLSLAEGRHNFKSLDLPNRLRAVNRRDSVGILKENFNLRSQHYKEFEIVDKGYLYTIEKISGDPLYVRIAEVGQDFLLTMVNPVTKDEQLKTGQNTLYLDAEALGFPLTIRSPLPGDVLYPSGMSGRQKLSKLFINRKIECEKRGLWPVLADKEEILWVAGLRAGRKACFGSAVPKLLKVELLLAK